MLGAMRLRVAQRRYRGRPCGRGFDRRVRSMLREALRLKNAGRSTKTAASGTG